MVKRKIDGAVDESSVDQKIHNSKYIHNYIAREKSGALYLAELGLMAGCQADEIWARFGILKACCMYVRRSKYVLYFAFCLAKVLIVSASLMHF